MYKSIETQSFYALFRFSPELLGVQASSALVWLIMEVLAVLLSLYLVTVNTDLTTIDLLAFSGYKYVGYVQHLSNVSVNISITSSPSCCLYPHQWYVPICTFLIANFP